MLKYLTLSHSGASGREFACQCRRCQRYGFNPWVGKILWSRKRQPTLVFLPGKSHGSKSLVSYSPWGSKESDMTEHMHKVPEVLFYFFPVFFFSSSASIISTILSIFKFKDSFFSFFFFLGLRTLSSVMFNMLLSLLGGNFCFSSYCIFTYK